MFTYSLFLHLKTVMVEMIKIEKSVLQNLPGALEILTSIYISKRFK